MTISSKPLALATVLEAHRFAPSVYQPTETTVAVSSVAASTVTSRTGAGALRLRGDRRRGTTLILTVFTLFVLFSFLAFSIDVGFLAGARAEMRRSADAASMAGSWEMYNQLKLGATTSTAQAAARAVAAQYALANSVVNQSLTMDSGPQSQEIRTGYLASLNSSSLSTNPDLPFMAVQVSITKSPQRNGEVPFFFGKIFGRTGQTMQSSATSVMAQSIKGFTLSTGSSQSLQILPFALDLQTWNKLDDHCAADDYCYDETTKRIVCGSDGQPEVNLYPQGTGSPGNRGTVDIGGANNSTADIARQIVNGISESDLNALGKPLALDDNGQLTLNGDTGISAGVKDELASIIGQTRVIPIFESVSGNGNNAVYKIVKWAGVRVLAVKLTGPMSQKMVMVQPAPIISRNVVVSSTTGASSQIFSPVLLVR